MKKMLNKTLGFVCALALLLSPLGSFSPTARAEESGESTQVSYEPDAGGMGAEETGMFVLAGSDDSLGSAPPEASAEDPLSLPGSDAEPEGDPTLSVARGEPLLGSGGDDLGAGVVTPNASPTVTLSRSSASLKKGETVSVTVTVSGYPSGSYLQSSNGNSSALSCAWGDWSGTSIPLRITGKATGSGTITVRLIDTNRKELVSKTISVSVVDSTPSLSISPSSLNMKTGESKQATLTVKNYTGGGSVSASVGNSSVCSVKWGSWTGWSIPITVTGKSGGSTKITLKLYNSVRTALATVTLNVTVSSNPTLSLSASSLTIDAGSSSSLTVTATGAASGDFLEYSLSNSTAYSGAWSGKWDGKSAKLTVTGKNEGSGTLKIALKNQVGTELTYKTIPVKVNPGTKPMVTVSPSSVSVNKDASAKVKCTVKNASGSLTLRYVNNSPSVLSCAWKDGWSGLTVPITITGKAKGTGSVTIQLLVNGTLRASSTISVTVTETNPDPNPNPNPNPNPSPDPAKSPSYSFSNYSKPGISLDLCKRMFGNTQRARTVYEWDIGNGGVCFGMAATSGLLSSPNDPPPATFGNSDITKLKKTDYSSTLRMSLSDFIEAMHITQVASSMKEYTGLSNLKDAVQKGGTSQPVMVCVRGPGGGHAILGYGLTSDGNVKVYDSNWPGQERTVKISGNTWSYELWSGLTWSSSNGKITYIPYSTYFNVWNSAGSLNGARLMDAILQDGEEELRYLLVTSADDFTLLDFEGNTSARYENGVLAEKADNVEEVFLDSALLNDDTPEPVHMLYVPKDLYSVKNQTSGKMDVALSGLDLSVRVNTEAKEFDLAVSDDENYANAILSLAEGDDYSISVGSSRNGEDTSSRIEGTGNGSPICLGIAADGLYISSTDSADDGLSLGEMEEGATSDNFTQDFTLNSVSYDKEYPVNAAAGPGGTITTADGTPMDQNGTVLVTEGGCVTFRIQPSKGYAIQSVMVNGKEAPFGEGADGYSYVDGAYVYTFRDVSSANYLTAVFSRDISECSVKLDYDLEGNYLVEVKDPATGKVLEEETDYILSRREGVNKDTKEPEAFVVIQAVSGSAYYGTTEVEDTIHVDGTPELRGAVYAPENNEIRVSVSNVSEYVLFAAAFDGNRMLAVLTPESGAEAGTERFSLEGTGAAPGCEVRIFLLSDKTDLRVLCKPASVRITAAQ